MKITENEVKELTNLAKKLNLEILEKNIYRNNTLFYNRVTISNEFKGREVNINRDSKGILGVYLDNIYNSSLSILEDNKSFSMNYTKLLEEIEEIPNKELTREIKEELTEKIKDLLDPEDIAIKEKENLTLEKVKLFIIEELVDKDSIYKSFLSLEEDRPLIVENKRLRNIENSLLKRILSLEKEINE